MKLTRLLAWAAATEKRWLSDFFAPEPVDLAALADLGTGLRERDGARVALIESDGSPARRVRPIGVVTVLGSRLGERRHPDPSEAALLRGHDERAMTRRRAPGSRPNAST
ncbi:hypothetical protein DSM104299_00975 [Baekduia alba]|nr:hypothetical protein DSM104299_00975 [Baekduia alba]